MSMSHFMIELKLRSVSVSTKRTVEGHAYTVSWIPRASSPSMLGWKRTSGARKLGRIQPNSCKRLRKLLPFIANSKDLSIREFVTGLDRRRTRSGIELLLEVIGDVAQLFLDIPDDFSLSGGSEQVSTFSELFDQSSG